MTSDELRGPMRYTENLYEQYLRVLDERDRAIERADDYEAVLRRFAEAQHDVCWNTWFIEDAEGALGRWGVELEP